MNTSWILPCALLLASFVTVNRGLSQEMSPPVGRSRAPSAIAIGTPQPIISPATSFAGDCGSNLILNGDFEANTATGCDFNLTNAAFDAEVANVTAFGTAEEIDVMKDPYGCGYAAPPYSGTTKIAIHRKSEPGRPVDAFSFDLAIPLVAGQKYHLQFFAIADVLSDPSKGAVEVGVSKSATDFGTLIATAFPGTGMWSPFDFEFVAPLSGSYLTVREGDFIAWTHLDAFSLVPVCSTNASWSNYGSGWPGTNGVPSFTSSGDPELCGPFLLSLANSRGVATSCALFLGVAAADIPTADGGHLLVLPSSVVVMSLPAPGINLPGCVPCDGALCGLSVYLQAWEADQGASQGISFTRGLKLVLGS